MVRYRQSLIETWSDQGGYPLPYEPTVYLPLEQTVQWNAEVIGGSLSPPAQPPQPAPARGDQTDSGHAPPPKKADTTSTPSWMNTAVSSIWRNFRSKAPTLPLNSSATASENSPLPLSVSRRTTAPSLPTGSTPQPRKS